MNEANRRFQTIEDARSLLERLRESEGGSFAGVWINHDPFEVVANAVVGHESDIREELRGSGVDPDVSRVSVVEYSEKELLEEQASVADALSQAGWRFGIGIDVEAGRVRVYAHSEEDLERLRAEDLPASTVVTRGTIPQPAALIYGGLPISTCTLGFSVKDPGGDPAMGVATAGHCSSPQYYASTYLPLQDEEVQNSTDAEWHSTPGYSDVNLIRDAPGSTREVTSTMQSTMMQGDVVCKWGKMTENDCGTIEDATFGDNDCVPGSAQNPGLVYVNNNNGDLAEGGDSGGPVFKGDPAKAWGLITCQTWGFFGDDTEDMVFMKISFLSNIGVVVKTQ